MEIQIWTKSYCLAEYEYKQSIVVSRTHLFP